jgi:hypothetical protein
MLPELTSSNDIKMKQNDCWRKLVQGWGKLKFDAGFNEEQNSGSLGMFLRVNKGRVILSSREMFLIAKLLRLMNLLLVYVLYKASFQIWSSSSC